MATIRVIIVGAGASGVAAAARLLEKGIKDVVILEAENRIGGRVQTVRFGSGVVDLGAQWVHGEKDNIISEMAQPLGLLGETLTEVTDGQFFNSSGALLGTNSIEKYLGLLIRILSNSEESLKDFKGSLGDYLTEEYKKQLRRHSKESVDETPYAKYFLDWFAKFENSIDGSDSWFYTSGPGHTHYRDCDGYLLQAWKSGGFSSIFNLLTKKYPDPSQALPVEDKVVFNKEVGNIEWDNCVDDKVHVSCKDGTKYTADRVIVTTSLGVLKERSRSMFTPELPARKLNAIYGLSIGTVDKIYLRFDRQWWPTGALGFSLIWTEEDEQRFNVENPTESGRHWLTDVFGFYEVDFNPNVLCGWVVGPSARIMEKLTIDQVNAGCVTLLNKFLGKTYQIPPPVEVLRTTWTLNPHFRGSYSFRSIDSDCVDTFAAHLAEPVANSNGKETLLFAGEATHHDFFSTVHGAVESGWREADRIIKQFSSSYLSLLSTEGNGTSGHGVPRNCRVAIIGGGISGLAAATTLLGANVKDIVILEAQDRAGGRIVSVPINTGWVEAGAQWIHGQNNPIWRLAQEHNLLSQHTSTEGEGPYLREDGFVFDQTLVCEIDDVITKLLEDCEQYSELDDIPVQIPRSIGEYLRIKFNEYLNKCSQDSEERRTMKEELFDWHDRFQIIDNSSDHLDKLSVKAWGNYSFSGGKDYVNFENGYSSLIDKITSSLPAGVLQLNCPVTKIAWKTSLSRESSPVTITHGSDDTLSAQHCIVTCSLGYLKEHHQSLFEPALPTSLARAIQDMGFATINKIFLVFETPWWESDIKGFQLVWSKLSKPSHSWTRDLTGFDVLPNHSAVLLGWIGGKGAELVEDLTEQKVGQHCAELLRQFTRRPEIPEPRQVLRTQWLKNRFIRGGYGNTTISCDSSRSGPAALARPVFSVDNPKHPVILLAGEATHDTFFSTTHGAYESGVKQAQLVINSLEKVPCCRI